MPASSMEKYVPPAARAHASNAAGGMSPGSRMHKLLLSGRAQVKIWRTSRDMSPA